MKIGNKFPSFSPIHCVCRRQWQKAFFMKSERRKRNRERSEQDASERKEKLNKSPLHSQFCFPRCFFSLAVGRGKVNLFHGIKDLFVLRWSRVCIQSEKCLIWKLIFEQIGSHIFFCAYHKDNPFYNFSSLCSWNRANNSKAIFQAIIFQQKLKAFFHFSISCFFTQNIFLWKKMLWKLELTCKKFLLYFRHFHNFPQLNTLQCATGKRQAMRRQENFLIFIHLNFQLVFFIPRYLLFHKQMEAYKLFFSFKHNRAQLQGIEFPSSH